MHNPKSRIVFRIRAISKIVIVSVALLVAIGALFIGIFLVANISHSTSVITTSSVITIGTCEAIAYYQVDSLTNLSYVTTFTVTTDGSTATYTSATFVETEPPAYPTTTSTYYLVTHANTVSTYTLTTNSTSSGGQACYPSYCYTVATCVYSP